jgi:hypothetical protein
MSTQIQHVKEENLSRRDIAGLVLWTLGVLGVVVLCLAGAMARLFYWKEGTPHYEAGCSETWKPFFK